MLDKYEVHLFFSAEHSFYVRNMIKKVKDENNINYKFPIFISESTAGNDVKEYQNPTNIGQNLKPFDYELSVGVLSILNRTHLLFE